MKNFIRKALCAVLTVTMLTSIPADVAFAGTYEDQMAEYNRKKAEYDKAMEEYNRKKAEYDRQMEEYNRKKTDYDKAMEEYNRQKAAYDEYQKKRNQSPGQPPTQPSYQNNQNQQHGTGFNPNQDNETTLDIRSDLNDECDDGRTAADFCFESYDYSYGQRSYVYRSSHGRDYGGEIYINSFITSSGEYSSEIYIMPYYGSRTVSLNAYTSKNVIRDSRSGIWIESSAYDDVRRIARSLGNVYKKGRRQRWSGKKLCRYIRNKYR